MILDGSGDINFPSNEPYKRTSYLLILNKKFILQNFKNNKCQNNYISKNGGKKGSKNRW